MVTQELLTQFIHEFKDQNPLSRLSIIVTRNEKAEILQDFSDNASNVLTLANDELDGNPSYQNALELAKAQIKMSVPDYAHKEVLVINSSITVCDPQDIDETIEALKLENIVCSTISLSAKVFILDHLTKMTNGRFFLVKDKEHYEVVLQKYLVPQFSIQEI